MVREIGKADFRSDAAFGMPGFQEVPQQRQVAQGSGREGVQQEVYPALGGLLMMSKNQGGHRSLRRIPQYRVLIVRTGSLVVYFKGIF